MPDYRSFIDAARAYARSIRNAAKKAYAAKYTDYLVRSVAHARGSRVVPVAPVEPVAEGLGTMGAQAVRLRLYALADEFNVVRGD